MTFADQTYADASDANAFVRAENILVSRRAENPRASGLQKATPIFHSVFLLKLICVTYCFAELRGLYLMIPTMTKNPMADASYFYRVYVACFDLK